MHGWGITRTSVSARSRPLQASVIAVEVNPEPLPAVFLAVKGGSHRPLRRSRRIVASVCGGLAEWLGWSLGF
jgi:hypothetical protein